MSTIVCELLAHLNDMVMSEIKKCNRTLIVEYFSNLSFCESICKYFIFILAVDPNMICKQMYLTEIGLLGKKYRKRQKYRKESSFLSFSSLFNFKS